jgi:hypothetical protein
MKTVKTTKQALSRRQFLAGSLAAAGTVAVTSFTTGCGGGNANQTLYTVQAVVGLILTVKQLLRRSAGVAPLSSASLQFLTPQAQVAQASKGTLQAVDIVADGLELHLNGDGKSLVIGHAYAIAPIVTTDKTNDALPGGTFTILSTTGNSIRFRVDNAQVQNGDKVVPVSWESSATIL